MIHPDKKKAATIILERLGQVTEVAPEEQMDDSMAGFHAAAQDLLAAIEGKSAENVAGALKAFVDQYRPDED